MNLTEKRIAIATDRGWNRFDYEMGDGDAWIPCGKRQHVSNLVADPPDYFQSPSAAVELLEALRREHGLSHVISQTVQEGWRISIGPMSEIVTFAPTFAAAVSEAYGRARNLWIE